MTEQQNPFRTEVFPSLSELAGRAQDVAALQKQLSQNQLTAVTGASGVGKSSAVLAAVRALARKAGNLCLRVDLGLYNSLDSAAQNVSASSGIDAASAARPAGAKPPQVRGDLLNAASSALGAPLDEDSAARGLEAMVALVRKLQSWAHENRSRAILVVDTAERLPHLGGPVALERLAGLAGSHPNLACVFCGDLRPEHIDAISGRGARAVSMYELKPVPREILAAWIDERFERSDKPGAGAGERSVRSGGQNMHEVLSAARREFEACVSARIGKSFGADASLRCQLPSAKSESEAPIARLSFRFGAVPREQPGRNVAI
jgi:hypothetical protein